MDAPKFSTRMSTLAAMSGCKEESEMQELGRTQRKLYVHFFLDGKRLLQYDLENEFAGERVDTILRLAYENKVAPEKIKIFIGGKQEIPSYYPVETAKKAGEDMSVEELVAELRKRPEVLATQIWLVDDVVNAFEDEAGLPGPPADLVEEVCKRVKNTLEDCSHGYEAVCDTVNDVLCEKKKGGVRMYSEVINSLMNAAELIQKLQEENESLKEKLKKAEKREFIVYTPKGNLKVWAKHETDSFGDYPGIYVDIINPDGDDLLCCVEYDSMADGLYARVYANGDEPTESIRFENLDTDKDSRLKDVSIDTLQSKERNDKAGEQLRKWENCGLSYGEAVRLGKLKTRKDRNKGVCVSKLWVRVCDG